MSDKRPDSKVDETLIRQVPNDDQTNVRIDTGSDESNSPADQTETRPSSSDPDSRTQIRDGNKPEDTVSPATKADPDDKTVIKSKASTSQSKDPGPEGSIPTLSDQAASEKAANELATNEPATSEQTTSEQTRTGAATILTEPGGVATEATIIREKIDAENATIIRGNDDATVVAGAVDDDATIIGAGGLGAGGAVDDDSTIIGGGMPGRADTTYIAAVGDQGKSKGNTEAGRLLKNRFVLEEKIGSGGMGDVYKALDLRQQEAKERNPYIAIKILNETFAQHKDAFISLQREATRTRGIPHPNIMGVYDFDREGDTVFMSMELLDGKPLDDYLKDHPEGVSTEDAWNIVDGICQGLARAHGAGIVHSDFKPGNIYYTDDKIAKVFDFGIARAVPTSDSDDEFEAEGDTTVFDAGSLGALTPTYASLEMLTGQVPTKSDDVYAVALVTYELFTGRHPYDRTPANKALEQGLVAEPIPTMKRRHWKALKKALQLKGEDRTQTIDEFREHILSEDPPYLRYAAIAALLMISVTYGVYQQFKAAEEIPVEYTQMRQVYDSSERAIKERIEEENFNQAGWRDQLVESLARLERANLVLQDNVDWSQYLGVSWEDDASRTILASKNLILDAYLKKIEALRNESEVVVSDTRELEQVAQAKALLVESQLYLDEVKEHYNFDLVRINEQEIALIRRMSARDAQLDSIERNRLENEARLVAEEEARVQKALDDAEEDRLITSYNTYITEFKEILRCKGDIPEDALASLQGVIKGLEDTYPERYALDKPGVVAALSACIQDRISVFNPEKAREVKKVVMTYLPGETLISGIVIDDKDPCQLRGLEGHGIRNRSWCEDELVAIIENNSDKKYGPELVVIPPLGSIDSFAISRMEIKIGEYNIYCELNGCQQIEGQPGLPATYISLTEAQAYIDWLSNGSGYIYRLPTRQEWLHAATATGESVDTNVNCTVDSRGVRLGDKLVNTLSGRPNSWGLYNFVGNAREWAMDGEDVLALGGAHTDPKSQCTVQMGVSHTGGADAVTGFRVVRQICKDRQCTETESTVNVSVEEGQANI